MYFASALAAIGRCVVCFFENAKASLARYGLGMNFHISQLRVTPTLINRGCHLYPPSINKRSRLPMKGSGNVRIKDSSQTVIHNPFSLLSDLPRFPTCQTCFRWRRRISTTEDIPPVYRSIWPSSMDARLHSAYMYVDAGRILLLCVMVIQHQIRRLHGIW
jgi:hypothetical protein